MTDDRYSRHVFLKEIGPEGQSRIAASRVFIIGAGGVGCPAALALVESGVASLTIADADAVIFPICRGKSCTRPSASA